jgi:hypothetical protein
MVTYGLPTGTDFTLEVLNGSGIGEANIFRNFDNDKYKNLLFRVSQDLGGHLRFGGFGYLGKEKKEAGANSLWMAGVDATVTSTPFELNLQYVERRDDNPFFAVSGLAPAESTATRGGFAELIYLQGR